MAVPCTAVVAPCTAGEQRAAVAKSAVQGRGTTSGDRRHAFESSAVVHWLTQYRGSHPITGEHAQPVPVAAVLHPLVISGRTDHLTGTRRILGQAASVIISEARIIMSLVKLDSFYMSLPVLLITIIGTS